MRSPGAIVVAPSGSRGPSGFSTHATSSRRPVRADSSRSRETGGYGIGLSLAQMLVQRQKGRLTAECSPEGIIRFDAEL